ncbi:UDP-N-acetyl-2-amino-2-deoxyglucuronate dehydrogenase [Draconibacterium orientale]|uniref:Oxidoreductase n=1 Tax=Draconibacterium orientale TaxID=1168034 RepID=X5E1J7_9BACT|nr:Gfo/Idh/MocA family oxidoreductase [Draconibacterium orientale]AHW61315.1 oxidoreductase [Draconibacterium orientale]SEU05499.1 UDP-N-acetyl-2-amino-2-deoxyglucuronate dehydrogenase [Draconibacterium orientale]
MEPKTFVLIGAAGYIAPKHFNAIQKIGGKLIAVIDPVDNLDILDDYFPNAEYFRSIEDAKPFMKTNLVDYFVVCSPTHLHFDHISFGLKNNCDVICESPLVLTWNELEKLKDIESQSAHKIYNLLQYRHDPAFIELKKNFDNKKHYLITLKNFSYRGKWLAHSWKGDSKKTGGLITALGYHFFDGFINIYGKPIETKLEKNTNQHCLGNMKLENATVDFELANSFKQEENRNELFIEVDEQIIDLYKSDKELFIRAYQHITNNKGIGISDIEPTIKFLEKR